MTIGLDNSKDPKSSEIDGRVSTLSVIHKIIQNRLQSLALDFLCS